MSLNNINFIKGKGGLGRPLAGKDYISGLLFYTASLPSGFSTYNRMKKVFSVTDAESLGIKNDYSDETKATGVYTISTAGATRDSISLVFTEPEGLPITLGTYVKLVTDTTVTLVASGLVNAINANTYITGYSASNLAGAITVTVRKGLGIFPNTGTPLTAVILGTIAGSVTTAVTGGVASLQAVWHYHISEFFRVQPKGFLWLGFFAIPATYDYIEIATMQHFANGDIRQMGVFVDSKAFTIGDLTVAQSVCNALDAEKMPLSVLYAGNMQASTLSTLSDLATLSNNKISVVIAQDAGGLGNKLWYAYGKSITALGATLGAVALSSVHESIAWVSKFNLSNGYELESIGFANGVKSSDISVTNGLLDNLDLKRYVFLRKFPNLSGSFFNDNKTAIASTSDYAFINDNRVIDKAIRGIDASLLPSLNSPLLLNSDGTLANSTIAYLESQAVINTDQMIRDNEVSAVGVLINPLQNVLTTGTLNVTVNIVPVGVARNIVVNIGFKTSL